MIVDNVVDGGPALRVPAHLSLGQHVIDCLRENCQQNAVALVNGDTGEETNYIQLLQGTVDTAVGLARLGVRRGDTVALCGENRLEYLYGALGVLCCGATITTMNVMYTKDELHHALNLSKPRIVLASEDALKNHLNTIQTFPSVDKVIQINGTSIATSVLLLKEVAVAGSDVRSYEPASVEGATDVSFILYSSGTTGLPKGVMLTHKNFLYSVALFELGKEQGPARLISIVPWYHAYGLMSTISYLIIKSFLVYFSGGFNPMTYLKCVQDYKIKELTLVPPIVVFLGKSPLVEQFDLTSVEVGWCGAAPLTPDTIKAALKRMPNCAGIFQAYGMTETSLAATKDRVEDNVGTKVGSGGYPIPGVKVKVVDIETLKKLGPNQNGEIHIKGPIIMKGYLGDEDATRQSFDDEGYLKTGDIGYYDNDGYFYIVDRLKELIKYKGNQVAPAAVESVLLQHGAVAECGVVGAPDPRAGELPTAFVVTKQGAAVSEDELKTFVASKLSSSSHLRGGVIFVKEIPKNPSGKILRRLLKQQLVQMTKSKL